MTHILTSCHSPVVRALVSCPAILGSTPGLVVGKNCEGNFLKVYPNGPHHVQTLAGKQDKGGSPLARAMALIHGSELMARTRGSPLYPANQQGNLVRLSNAYDPKTPASPLSRPVPTHVHIRFGQQ